MERAPDRRVARTREAIMDNFLDLMIEKGYEAITVQDIIDRANIGRSTFYLHFTDKENLLLSSIGQLGEFIKDQARNRKSVEADGYRFGFSLAMLQHSQAHKRVYKAVVGKKTEAPVIYQMQKMLSGLVRDEIELIFGQKKTDVPVEVLSDFAITSFFTVLTWWLDNNTPCSAFEADNLFHKLVTGGLSAFS